MGTRSGNSPIALADEIAKAHPAETWEITSNALETNGFNYYVASWLGDEIGFDRSPDTGAICFFDPKVVMKWVMKEPRTRAHKLVRCLPKTLNAKRGGLITVLFLEQFGDDARLASSLISHFATGGWRGPESAYLSKKRDEAREWVKTTKAGRSLSWLYQYIEYLGQRIEWAELQEECWF